MHQLLNRVGLNARRICYLAIASIAIVEIGSLTGIFLFPRLTNLLQDIPVLLTGFIPWNTMGQVLLAILCLLPL